MVSAVISGTKGLGSNPDRGHCVAFLSKTLNSQSCFSPPRCLNGYRQLILVVKVLVTDELQ